MSENVLRLIPVEPRYVPSVSQIAEAKKLLSGYFDKADRVTVEQSSTVTFVDQGANFQKILCPLCDSVISIDWWHDAMDQAYAGNFENLSVITPCCSAESSLNDPVYDWPAGFSCFQIEVWSPGNDLTQDQLTTLEALLGCTLRRIWAHY